MIKVGDMVKFKIQRAGTQEKIEFTGIVNGKSQIFGQPEYIVTEWKAVKPISVRKVVKIK